jgi:hypothetical protein
MLRVFSSENFWSDSNMIAFLSEEFHPVRQKVISQSLYSSLTFVAELKAYFEAFGKVKEVKIIKEKKTNVAKGYGFVFFKCEKTFDRIKDMVHVLNGRTLDLNVGCKKSTDPEMVIGR